METLLEPRLRALESARSRERVALLIVASVVGIAAADAPREILARRLEIVDDAGRTAAVLAAHAMGGGIVTLFDANQRPLVALGAGNGGSLLLRSPDGHDLVRIGMSENDRRGAIVVYNSDGRAVVQLTTDSAE